MTETSWGLTYNCRKRLVVILRRKPKNLEILRFAQDDTIGLLAEPALRLGSGW